MSFAVGSLVKVRGREWVVLPDSNEDLLLLRPLGGAEDEVTGILTKLEPVSSAQFDLPDPRKIGDHRSCRFLRDAVRFSTRSSCGPFRSFARIAVEPRPYQLVPLLMALKLDPIRLLIADDVGIGKTIEALLVARELYDRGEVRRIAVLCPPHLAEQWQKELNEKFHIEAELVLSNTAARLERVCRVGESLFEVYPHVVVSMDFIKTDRRRDEFVRACPEMVIIDEAHTCAFGYEDRGRHQRNQMVSRLAQDPRRHMIFVTATPHSGKEESFRSLLSFLNHEFANLPDYLSGDENEPKRRNIAAHFVQRRRADIVHFLNTDTPFPVREESEQFYTLTPDYKRLMNRVLEYTKEIVIDEEGGQRKQRVRWWSALALLRALASSPAAAAASLRNRTPAIEAETSEEIEEIGRHSVFDLQTEEQIEGVDITPGSDSDDAENENSKARGRLLDMAREAEKLKGDNDPKLKKAVTLLKELIHDNYSPIVFCRFIHTADYLAEELRSRIRGVEIISVTGLLPPADREMRITELSKHEKRILVCTDCLSEGINLQEHFDAVMHYDLSWNPTRHEQREGRVDRYRQRKPRIRVLTYYGKDNPIDGIVIDILIRKHKKIRSSLGISVPVPADSDAVMSAMFEGLLLRNKEKSAQLILDGFDQYMKPKKEQLHLQWDNASEKEKRSRTMFAQESIKPAEVAQELEQAQVAVGSAKEVEAFSLDSLKVFGAAISSNDDSTTFDLREIPRALREQLQIGEKFKARFELPIAEDMVYLHRTHPVIESLASYVLDTALDSSPQGIAHRSGAIRTRAVTRRTTLLLLRFRFDLMQKQDRAEFSQLAEECRLLAFAGSPSTAEWLDESIIKNLLIAEPHGNVLLEFAREQVSKIVDSFDLIRPRIEEEARSRAMELLSAHQRLRLAAKISGIKYEVKPQLPADVLGIYIYLPVTQ
jgi:ERCC4-related helicase